MNFVSFKEMTDSETNKEYYLDFDAAKAYNIASLTNNKILSILEQIHKKACKGKFECTFPDDDIDNDIIETLREKGFRVYRSDVGLAVAVYVYYVHWSNIN